MKSFIHDYFAKSNQVLSTPLKVKAIFSNVFLVSGFTLLFSVCLFVFSFLRKKVILQIFCWCWSFFLIWNQTNVQRSFYYLKCALLQARKQCVQSGVSDVYGTDCGSFRGDGKTPFLKHTVYEYV